MSRTSIDPNGELTEGTVVSDDVVIGGAKGIRRNGLVIEVDHASILLRPGARVIVLTEAEWQQRLDENGPCAGCGECSC